MWECRKCNHKETQYQIERRENGYLRLANTKPSPYNIRTCLQQLHDLSKVLHNNHIIIVNLKQKFLFSFSINMKKVRDLSPDQRRKLAPLFIAQEKYCRQLLTYHEVGMFEETISRPLTLILWTHYTSAMPGRCVYVCGRFWSALADWSQDQGEEQIKYP